MKKIVLLIIAVAVIGFFVYLHYKNNVSQPIPTVTVTKGTITSIAQAIGYIKPQHSSTVKSAVDGSVQALYHDAGDYVKKGEPLLKVEPQPDPSVYAEAYQNLQSYLVQEKEAKKNLDRYIPALKSGLITRNYGDYIAAKKDYGTLREQRILAKQKLALLDQGSVQVGTKKIGNVVISPMNGYILTRNVDVGDPVISLSSAQSSTPLFTMANMNDLMFEGSVDEMDAAKIHLNMPATITVGANAKETLTGIVTKIALQSEQENATTGSPAPDANLPFNVSFQIEVTKFKIPKNFTLRSGYSATADMNIKTVKDVLMLPERVLHFDSSTDAQSNNNKKIYVLLPPKDADQEPAKREVTVGLSDGMMVEITSGLKLGDKVLDQPDTETD